MSILIARAATRRITAQGRISGGAAPGVRGGSARDPRWTALPPHILLAEDDDEMRRLVAHSLRRDGFQVTEARSGSELLELLASLILRDRPDGPDLIVTDLRMPGFSGMDVLAGLRRAEVATPVILVTAFGDPELHAEARRLGALAVIDKPFDIHELREFIRHNVPPPS